LAHCKNLLYCHNTPLLKGHYNSFKIGHSYFAKLGHYYIAITQKGGNNYKLAPFSL